MSVDHDSAYMEQIEDLRANAARMERQLDELRRELLIARSGREHERDMAKQIEIDLQELTAKHRLERHSHAITVRGWNALHAKDGALALAYRALKEARLRSSGWILFSAASENCPEIPRGGMQLEDWKAFASFVIEAIERSGASLPRGESA